jgi:hypothetical protein
MMMMMMIYFNLSIMQFFGTSKTANENKWIHQIQNV